MSLNRPVKLQIKQVENKLDKLYKGLQSVDKKYMKTFFKHTETLNRSSQSPEYFSASSQEEYFTDDEATKRKLIQDAIRMAYTPKPKPKPKYELLTKRRPNRRRQHLDRPYTAHNNKPHFAFKHRNNGGLKVFSRH